MFAGVSGLRSHQTMMDVIGNNIANVNTIGYKSSSVVFQDLLSQMVQSGATPGAGATGQGGVNPAQVGLGVKLSSITSNFGQGATQVTGRATDVSIEGDGFFVVRSGSQQLFSRAGSFSFDSLGRIVSPSGGVVQGWPAAIDGTINSNAPVGDLVMPLGQAISPTATAAVTVGGNLNADMPVASPGNTLSTSIVVYDLQGTPITTTMTFTHGPGANDWTVDATMPDTAGGPDVNVGTTTMTWDPTTQTFTPAPSMTLTPTAATGQWAAGATIDVDFGTPGSAEAITAFSGPSSAALISQDGKPAGTLQSFSIGRDGTVMGVFSNGQTQAVGRVALASFANPAGLEKAGDSTYRSGANSGLARIGTAGTNGLGALNGFSLEMSNVDLAQEFTELIVAQRGFQANSRVITASDELLQDLVNLKR
jgi:flagellar hook protein FlgE